MTVVKGRWPSEGGRPFEAFIAPLIAETVFSISNRTLRACDDAVSALSQIGAQPPVAWEPVGRLLLRAEGLASSDIEGIQVTPRRLLQAMVGETHDQPAQWVLDNIDAVQAAYGDADEDLTTGMMLRWHGILMSHSPLPREYVGAFREVQGWIGGMDPSSAVFVPAPPEFIDDLMEDLVEFANRRDLPPVWQAAVLHAQFETIHPFSDGNGRVGRALIGWCLTRRGALTRAVPPLSPVIARQPDRYVHGLWLYRDGQLDPWVTWFADVCEAAANSVDGLTAAIASLQHRWQADLSDLRSDGSARRLLAELPALPVIDTERAASTLNVSDRSARSALRILEERGVLEPLEPIPGGPGRPRKLWAAGGLVDLL
ncbi:MAG: Fic family protein [Acidimicrobiia bacterium]